MQLCWQSYAICMYLHKVLYKTLWLMKPLASPAIHAALSRLENVTAFHVLNQCRATAWHLSERKGLLRIGRTTLQPSSVAR